MCKRTYYIYSCRCTTDRSYEKCEKHKYGPSSCKILAATDRVKIHHDGEIPAPRACDKHPNRTSDRKWMKVEHYSDSKKGLWEAFKSTIPNFRDKVMEKLRFNRSCSGSRSGSGVDSSENTIEHRGGSTTSVTNTQQGDEPTEMPEGLWFIEDPVLRAEVEQRVLPVLAQEIYDYEAKYGIPHDPEDDEPYAPLSVALQLSPGPESEEDSEHRCFRGRRRERNIRYHPRRASIVAAHVLEALHNGTWDFQERNYENEDQMLHDPQQVAIVGRPPGYRNVRFKSNKENHAEDVSGKAETLKLYMGKMNKSVQKISQKWMMRSRKSKRENTMQSTDEQNGSASLDNNVGKTPKTRERVAHKGTIPRLTKSLSKAFGLALNDSTTKLKKSRRDLGQSSSQDSAKATAKNSKARPDLPEDWIRQSDKPTDSVKNSHIPGSGALEGTHDQNLNESSQQQVDSHVGRLDQGRRKLRRLLGSSETSQSTQLDPSKPSGEGSADYKISLDLHESKSQRQGKRERRGGWRRWSEETSAAMRRVNRSDKSADSNIITKKRSSCEHGNNTSSVCGVADAVQIDSPVESSRGAEEGETAHSDTHTDVADINAVGNDIHQPVAVISQETMA